VIVIGSERGAAPCAASVCGGAILRKFNTATIVTHAFCAFVAFLLVSFLCWFPHDLCSGLAGNIFGFFLLFIGSETFL